MNLKQLPIVALLLVAASFPATLGADLPAATRQELSGPTTRPINPTYARLAGELQSNDDGQIKSALAEIKAAAAKRGRGFAGPGALNLLFDAKRYDDIDAIALAQIIANPADAAYDGNFQKARARALMLAGKKNEALAAAQAAEGVQGVARAEAAATTATKRSP